MSLDQLDTLLERIKVHCPFFMKGYDKAREKLQKKEWYKVLINYDFLDVNKELDAFLANNPSATPTVYELVNGISKISNKQVGDDELIFCTICKKRVPLKNYKNHYRRCLSQSYLENLALKYYGTKLDKEKLNKLSDEEFDSFYYDSCKKILPKLLDPREIYRLKSIIEISEGKELNLNYDEFIGKININKNERRN